MHVLTRWSLGRTGDADLIFDWQTCCTVDWSNVHGAFRAVIMCFVDHHIAQLYGLFCPNVLRSFLKQTVLQLTYLGFKPAIYLTEKKHRFRLLMSPRTQLEIGLYKINLAVPKPLCLIECNFEYVIDWLSISVTTSQAINANHFNYHSSGLRRLRRQLWRR